MLDVVQDLQQVIVHDLYEAYPDFCIDANREKRLLLQSDLVIFHHPMYWYSSPPMIKLWQDVVLEQGFAYGPGGDALQGKDFMLALSTGGKSEAYRAGGHNLYTIEELLRPFHATANLCGMHYHQPFLIQGSYECSQTDIDAHALSYQALLRTYLENGPIVFSKQCNNL